MTDQTDVVMRLLDKIEEQQQKIEELEKHTAKLQAHKNIKESQQEKEENNEDNEDVFFKAMKPRNVGYSERKNAISEWFKQRDKFETASIPKISKKVFGYRTKDSTDKHYIAIRNAIQKEPRVIPSNNKDGKFKEYKLSNKVKTE